MGKVATAIVVAFVIAALSFTLTHAVLVTRSPKFLLTAGSGITVTSTISSSSSTQTAAILDPGVPDYLWVTVTNPLTMSITKNSLSITWVTSPTGCSALTNLSYNSSIFSGSLPVRANNGTNTVYKPISLIDTAADQGACKYGTFTFAYSGTATYTDVASAILVSSLNPFVSGLLTSLAMPELMRPRPGS